MVFSLIASYLGKKERISNFFHVVLIFIELGQYLTHLAQKENTQSEIFLLGRLKSLIAFCSLRALRYYKMLSDVVEILTLQSFHKLLKNLGALSKYAKCSQSSTKSKKFKIAILYLEYNGMVKKPSHAIAPLN
jgi:hypothetical protein